MKKRFALLLVFILPFFCEITPAGDKNPDIAARLVLSPKTVRNHVTNILSKLQVADRSEAIIRAREAGLGQDKT